MKLIVRTFSFLGLLVVSLSMLMSVTLTARADAFTKSDAEGVLRAAWVAECYSKNTNSGEMISGELVDSYDGRTKCNRETFNDIVHRIGYTDYADFDKKINCKDCSREEVYKKLIEQKPELLLFNAMKYYIAHETFMRTCIPQKQEDQSNGDLIRSVVISQPKDDKSGMQDVRYVYGAAAPSAISTINPSSGWGGNGVFGCESLAKETQKYSKDYAIALQSGAAPAVSGEDAGTGNEAGENACNIEGIGWIVCPVTTFLGEAADVAYGMVDGYLKIEPSLLENDALEGAWRSFLAIANAGFIFVFIVIIYTQLTGMGSTSVGANYQLKRMLPRLLVAAVLVNLSYIICSLAVDLSNIVGANIGGLINSMSSTGTGVGPKNWAEGLGQGLVVGSLAVVAIGAGVAAIAFFLPALLSALLAILVMLLIILGRKAAVVLLIAVSPLAFLAWVLPNTGSLFQKWWKMFSAMLVLYPIIAIVFSGSKLAANIVSNTASGDDWQLQAVALAIATVPFLVIPSLLKNALNSLGTVGAKLSSITDRTAKTAGKNAKDRSKIGDYMKFRGRQADIRRAKIRSGIKPYGSLLPGGKLNPLNARRIALNGMATANNAFNKSSKTGEFGKEQHNAANRLLNELEIKEVNAAKANIERAMLDGKIDMADLAGLKELALGKSHGGIVADKYTQAEAMRQITTRGGYGDIKGMIDAVSASGDEAAIRSLGDVMATASNRPTWLQGSNLGQLQRGEGVNSEQLIDNAINSRVYSAEKIAVGDKEELADVATRAVDVKATLDPVGLQTLKDNASFAQTDSTLKAKIGKNVAEVGHLAGGTKP